MGVDSKMSYRLRRLGKSAFSFRLSKPSHENQVFSNKCLSLYEKKSSMRGKTAKTRTEEYCIMTDNRAMIASCCAPCQQLVGLHSNIFYDKDWIHY